jgi:hypothetical protein
MSPDISSFTTALRWVTGVGAPGSAALALALGLGTALVSGSAPAEDGNLEQRLLFEQHKSQFELKLEHARERALARARERQGDTTIKGGFSSGVTSLDNGHQTLRLTNRAPPAPALVGEPSNTAVRVQSREQREQFRQIIRHEQQRRSALVLDQRPRASADTRHRLSGFRAQHKQHSFQRKLSR